MILVGSLQELACGLEHGNAVFPVPQRMLLQGVAFALDEVERSLKLPLKLLLVLELGAWLRSPVVPLQHFLVKQV